MWVTPVLCSVGFSTHTQTILTDFKQLLNCLQWQLQYIVCQQEKLNPCLLFSIKDSYKRSCCTHTHTHIYIYISYRQVEQETNLVLVIVNPVTILHTHTQVRVRVPSLSHSQFNPIHMISLLESIKMF